MPMISTDSVEIMAGKGFEEGVKGGRYRLDGGGAVDE